MHASSRGAVSVASRCSQSSEHERVSQSFLRSLAVCRVASVSKNKEPLDRRVATSSTAPKHGTRGQEMQIKRRFTTAGKSPYEKIPFRRATSEIKNPDGSVVFSLQDFAVPTDCLGPPIRRVVLYPPSRRDPLTLVSDRDEFRVGDMGPLYVAAAAAAIEAGARIALGTRFVGRRDDAVQLQRADRSTRIRARSF